MDDNTNEQVRALRADLAVTQQRMQHLQTQVEAGPARAGRRNFLKLAAAGAAAGTAVTLASSTSAAAADPLPVLLGVTNNAPDNTPTGLQNGDFGQLATNVLQVKNWGTFSLGPDANFRTAFYAATSGIETTNLVNTGVRVGIHGEALANTDAVRHGVGVLGCANRTIGLLLPADGTGVYGTAEGTGTAVKGLAYGGAAIGVHGVSANTVGVQAEAIGSGGIGLNALAPTSGIAARVDGRLRHVTAATAGAPSFAANAGEQWRDSNGDMWICTAAGSPGTWRKVVAQHPNFPSAGGSVNFLQNPIRILDTRPSSVAPQSNGFSPLTANTDLQVDVATVNVGGVLVPVGATGIIGNLTAVPLTANGFMTLWAENVVLPGTSNLNFRAGINIANSFVCALSPAGKVRVRSSVATNVLLDVVGFLF